VCVFIFLIHFYFVYSDIVGALEYDQSVTTIGRQDHRDYLWKQAKFKQVCAITNQTLQRKIHQTYRAQYIQVCVCFCLNST
jgi:hypothetical protein